jgi:hypothetical protein
MANPPLARWFTSYTVTEQKRFSSSPIPEIRRAVNRGNLLVVLLEGGSEAQLREAIARRADAATAVHIVAPAHVSALRWLATDEDEARAEADMRALAAEWSLAEDAEVEGEGGDVDPVQAVEDALRSFPADEILVVAGSDEGGGLDESLRAFGLPVTRLGGSVPVRGRDRARERARRIVYGRSRATPFVFFAGVNLTLVLLAVLISLVVVLVVWLRRG